MPQVTEEYVFIDKRKNPFVLTDKLVIFKWLPFIGDTGFAIYSIYVGLTNKDSGYAFPSLNRLRKFLKKDKKTIIKYNRLLEQYGLITIERVQSSNGDFTSNRYYINEVQDLPIELSEKYEDIKLLDKDPIQNTTKKNNKGGGGMIPPPSGKSDQGVVESFHHLVESFHHVVESFHPKETNTNNTNIKTLSPGESDIKIPEHSIFSLIPKSSLKKLVKKYSEETVYEAIESLDSVYRGRSREVRSPIALLKTALEEGFEPARPKSVEKQIKQKSKDQMELEEKWIQTQARNQALSKTVKTAWDDLMERFSIDVSEQVFETWFNPLVPIELKGKILFVDASSRTIADCVEKKWLTNIREIVVGQSYPFSEVRLVI